MVSCRKPVSGIAVDADVSVAAGWLAPAVGAAVPGTTRAGVGGGKEGSGVAAAVGELATRSAAGVGETVVQAHRAARVVIRHSDFHSPLTEGSNPAATVGRIG